MRLFGEDSLDRTQLDWIKARSKHQLLLIDAAQSVRPHDLSPLTLSEVVRNAKDEHRHFRLTTQMRVHAGADYVEFVRRMLRGEAPPLPDLGEYDLRFFDDLGKCVRLYARRMLRSACRGSSLGTHGTGCRT